MLHNNEVIRIEETYYHTKSNSCVRIFTLNNYLSNFQITIKNTGATLISCKNGKEEFIRPENDENLPLTQSSQAANLTINKKNQFNDFEWQSHVLGLDQSISFATNSHHNSTITYQLKQDNSLIMLGKLRSVSHLVYLAPFYFNLNTNSSIDGHFLHIKSIKLDNAFENPNLDTGLSFNLTGNDLSNTDFLSCLKTPARINWSNSQDNKIYDLVYTLEGTYKEASIVAILSYGSKKIEVILQNTLNNFSNQISNSFTQQQAITSNQQQNNQNLCKLRIKINQFGISLLPVNMLEFKVTYRFYL